MGVDFYKDYDCLIRLACPDYDHCLNLMAKNVPKNARTLLDLGSGTGNLILRVLDHHSGIRVWGIELQPRLIRIAHEKLLHSGRNSVRFIHENLLDCSWPKAEVVTSSLTIHHFTKREKIKVFKKIYNDSDYFLFFDLVKGENKAKERQNLERIFSHMRRNGVSKEIIEKAREDMDENDKPLTLRGYNDLFTRIGFDYEVLYLKKGFAVYLCTKKE